MKTWVMLSAIVTGDTMVTATVIGTVIVKVRVMVTATVP